jgi:hypothetical protein
MHVSSHETDVIDRRHGLHPTAERLCPIDMLTDVKIKPLGLTSRKISTSVSRD